MIKVELIVHGRVQGVGFRFSVCQLAQKIGSIAGAVWNNNDGTVGIHAQSTDAMALHHFINKVEEGPSPFSRVDNVTIKEGQFDDYDTFKEKWS